MGWYVKIIIYLISIIISLFALYQIDFNKFIRSEKRQLVLFVYIILSLGLGALLGILFVNISETILYTQ